MLRQVNKKKRLIAIHETGNGQKDSFTLQAFARSSDVVKDHVMPFLGHSLQQPHNSYHPEWPLLVANHGEYTLTGNTS